MRDEIKQVEFRKSERIFLVDPGRGDELRDPLSGEYMCDNCSSHYVAIIKLPCLLKIVAKIREKIPLGRKVRVVYGALKNPCAPGTMSDATRLQSDEEVEAFFWDYGGQPSLPAGYSASQSNPVAGQGEQSS